MKPPAETTLSCMIHTVVHFCQGGMITNPTDLPVVVVAGVAGSGKTTLGRALARAIGMPLLDLDSLTNPLLDVLDGLIAGPHWNSSGPHAEVIRAGRYAVLRSAARDIIAINQRPVLVAPFAREMAAGEEWDALTAAVAPAPVRVIHVDGSADLLARRRLMRRAPRDAHRAPDPPPTPPRVPHLRVDAALTTEQQVFRVIRALGIPARIDLTSPLFMQVFDAVLFDLDGTLVDSTAAVLRSWERLGHEYPLDLAGGHVYQEVPARELFGQHARTGTGRVGASAVDPVADRGYR